MIIMVQKGYEDLSNYLKEKAYNVVHDNQAEYHDVYIYKSSVYEGLYNNLMNNNDLFQSSLPNEILMINMNNRTFFEIEEMINRKKYSNIFESEGFF